MTDTRRVASVQNQAALGIVFITGVVGRATIYQQIRDKISYARR